MRSTPRVLLSVLVLSALLSGAGQAQGELDTEAIHRMLDRFAELEDAMDEPSQAALMSDDRVWIAQGQGRRTDQALNTQIQQAQHDALQRSAPGVRLFTDYRDRLIRFYGDGSVAVASFYSYTTAIVPPNAPEDIAADLAGLQPAAMTFVLEKRDGDWKVVHVHVSDLGAPPGP